MPKALALTIEAFVVIFALLVAYGCALSVGYAIEHGLWASLALVMGSYWPSPSREACVEGSRFQTPGKMAQH